MLPYRLRPPIYGKRLKQRKQQEDPDYIQNAAVGGGPLQRALEKDLVALRPEFVEHLSQQSSTADVNKPGFAFAAFKQVFGGAKVAVLHSRFLPPRCDPGAYSQLLYACCLSILQQTLEQRDGSGPNSSNDFPLHDAAFAVFCLYALYETNPLPSGPDANDAAGQLSMLPMAQQNRENPKLLFRRCFKAPIRISLALYARVVSLRDTALSLAADTQAARSTLASNGGGSGGVRDNSQYAVAMDLVQVIDRLDGLWDFCAYTGPCSVEGLACHSDYPFALGEPPRTLDQASAVTEQPQNAVNPVANQEAEPWQFSNELQTQLDTYLSRRQDIRLPILGTKPLQQSKRIRDALEPMFRTIGEDPLLKLKRTVEGGDAALSTQPRRSRRVTFASMVVDAASVPSKGHTDDAASAQGQSISSQHGDGDNEQGDSPKPPSYELVLPVGMPLVMEESIQSAVETLLERNDIFLDLQAPQVSQSIQGDVSTIGTGGVSVTSGVGRNALQSLLSHAGNGGASVASTAGGGRNALQSLLSQVAAGPVREPPRKRKMHSFLDVQDDEVDSDAGGAANNATRDFSDLSSDDGVASVALSAVGRNAIAALLSQARKKRRKGGSSKRKKVVGKKQSKRKRKKQSSMNVDAEEEEDSDAESAQSELIEQGKSALDSLLKLAMEQTQT